MRVFVVFRHRLEPPGEFRAFLHKVRRHLKSTNMGLERLLKEVKQSLSTMCGPPHAEALSLMAALQTLWYDHLESGGKHMFLNDTREDLQEQGLSVRRFKRFFCISSRSDLCSISFR